eukprot:CAMPEP_0184244804 /NCGR_PEP_ID=MMETSP0977-20130417/1091_1 /TAXON_ID=483370 /ORGANISM="non described non described, Strain CCMP2097" /LENGTH=80 /DNA_ID=CAMNT_0026550097 /DNA_START=67 /DNA_END=305 /DNA_ORIENTATION=+
MATAMKRAADFGADDAATFGSDACNTAQNPANKAAKHASSLVPAVTVEAKKKREPKKVAAAAPTAKGVSEGIDEDAHEAP